MTTITEEATEAVRATWHLLPELPSTPTGTERCFVIAVRRARNGKTYSFPAMYLNGYPLIYDEGRCGGIAGKSCPEDGSHEDGCPTTGWFSDSSEGEYDHNYSHIHLDPGDEFLAWTNVPQFDPGALAPQAEGRDTGLEYPVELTPSLKAVLSTMLWHSGAIAEVMRKGGKAVPRQAEEEQAAVLHWMIPLAIKHGPEWAKKADAELKALRTLSTKEPE